MRKFCETLPDDRILRGNDSDMDSILGKEERRRTYRVASTGALLTYHSALSILARYASSLVRIIFSYLLQLFLTDFAAIRKGDVNTSHVRSAPHE